MNRFSKTCLIFFFLPALSWGSVVAGKNAKDWIVIDPGHGGSDVGAKVFHQGTPLYEKNLCLLLALDLKRELIIRGYSVALTREDDRDITLADRTALANRLQAKAFISLHMNALEASQKLKNETAGVELFVLNHASDAASKRVADLENSVLKDSAVTKDAPNAPVALIMKDLVLDSNRGPSQDLACAIHHQLSLSRDLKSRGIKQALFHVLLGADMPTVLIEAGFISHPGDRTRILETRPRMGFAAALARGVDSALRPRKTSSLPPRSCKIQTDEAFKRTDPK